MNIIDVKINGLSEIYRGIKLISDSQISNNKSFGNHLYQVLNDLTITFMIEDTNEFEYVILKEISTYITPFIENKEIKLSYIADNFSDIYSEAQGMTVLINQMNTQLSCKHNTKIDLTRVFMPSGCLTGSCIVSFNGNNLIPLMNGNLMVFLNTIIPEYMKPENMKNNNTFIKITDDIKNAIVKDFLTFFYNEINMKIFSLDLLSDFMIDDKYSNIFNSLDENPLGSYKNSNSTSTNSDTIVVAKSLSDSEFSVDIFGNTMYLSNIKAEVLHKNIKPKMSDIKIKFIISSSFASYFDLVNILPMDCFKDSDSLKVLNQSNNEIPINVLVKDYKARINSIESKLVQGINDCYNTTNNVIKKNELIMNYSNIRYTIEISLQDVNTYLNDIEYNIEDVVTYDTKMIINSIFSTSKEIYNIYFK